MLSIISIVLSFAAAVAVATVLHAGARRFVRDRLRYVDSVQKGFVPFLAGGAALLVMLPVVAVVPIIGIGTALTAGLAVGSGVAAGVRDIRSGAAPLIRNY